MSTKTETPQGVGTEDLLAVEAAQALERIRASKNITRRGLAICGQVMGEMLRIGWKKEQLDALEILFWSCRDGNGEPLKHSSANNSRHDIRRELSELWDADPNCTHNITNAPGGGVKCTKCRGWFCY